MWMAVPPAKSSEPRTPSQPTSEPASFVPKSQYTTGRYTATSHSGTKTAQAENFMRSATAPEMSAGVMTAKVIKKMTGTRASPFRPDKPAEPSPPMIPPHPLVEITEKPNRTHTTGTMPMQYTFIISMLSTFLVRTMPP